MTSAKLTKMIETFSKVGQLYIDLGRSNEFIIRKNRDTVMSTIRVNDIYLPSHAIEIVGYLEGSSESGMRIVPSLRDYYFKHCAGDTRDYRAYKRFFAVGISVPYDEKVLDNLLWEDGDLQRLIRKHSIKQNLKQLPYSIEFVDSAGSGRY